MGEQGGRGVSLSSIMTGGRRRGGNCRKTWMSSEWRRCQQERERKTEEQHSHEEQCGQLGRTWESYWKKTENTTRQSHDRVKIKREWRKNLRKFAMIWRSRSCLLHASTQHTTNKKMNEFERVRKQREKKHTGSPTTKRGMEERNSVVLVWWERAGVGSLSRAAMHGDEKDTMEEGNGCVSPTSSEREIPLFIAALWWSATRLMRKTCKSKGMMSSSNFEDSILFKSSTNRNRSQTNKSNKIPNHMKGEWGGGTTVVNQTMHDFCAGRNDGLVRLKIRGIQHLT